MYTAGVLTVSDSVFAKTREDSSGPAVRDLLLAAGFQIAQMQVIPDDLEKIKSALVQLCGKVQLVVTTGGTGIAHRDVTPEGTLAIADKVLAGVAELMRAKGQMTATYASLSRAVCVTRGSSMVLNLPGSPEGARQSLQAVIHLLPH